MGIKEQGIASYENFFKFLKISSSFRETYLKAVSNQEGSIFALPLSKFLISSERYKRELSALDMSDFDEAPGLDLSIDSRVSFFVESSASKPLCFVSARIDGDVAFIRFAPLNLTVLPSPLELKESLSTILTWIQDVLLVPSIRMSSRDVKTSGLDVTQLSFENIEGEPTEFTLEWTGEDFNPNGEMILTAGPSISQKESFYSFEAASHGWNGQWSGYIQKFEDSFLSFLGAEHGFSTSSCTGALHLALRALDIGPGDEVIVPEITWVATASAVRYVGATPVFVDVESSSWCIDPESFRNAITSKTKAVIPVHLYGYPANMTEVMAIAKDNNLYVIEDAAPAIGAKIGDQKVGTFGDFAAFSFQGAKLLVTGEGGFLVARTEELKKKAWFYNDHGRKPGTFWIEAIGNKYKMSNVQAALGLGQIERAKEQIAAKRRIFDWYEKHLKGFDRVQLNREVPGSYSIYWMTSVLVPENGHLDRDGVIQELRRRKVDSRPVFPAISQYPMWPDFSNPTAKDIGNRGINLPSGVKLKESHVKYICEQLKDILK